MKRINKKYEEAFTRATVKGMTRFNRLLVQLGNWMQRKTNPFSGSRKRWFLLAFSGVWVLECLLLVRTGFKEGKDSRFAIAPIRSVPAAMSRDTPGPSKRDPEHRELENLILYLTHHEHFRDSLARSCPGLMDSLHDLQIIYKEKPYEK